ncbi:MAG: YqgE/AlgH family protein [Pseudomonadota bacterium]
MPDSADKRLNLTGHFLIAMPGMGDERFQRSVVLICSHSDEGAMGFVLNQRIVSPTFLEILEELDLDMAAARHRRAETTVPVFSGGPVEQGRGFVIHSLDYGSPGTSRVGDLGGVTATLDVLRALAGPHPPEKAIMMLGYSGWGAGQLEQELADNGWLTLRATRELLYEPDPKARYAAALAALGVSEELLSASAGNA